MEKFILVDTGKPDLGIALCVLGNYTTLDLKQTFTLNIPFDYAIDTVNDLKQMLLTILDTPQRDNTKDNLINDVGNDFRRVEDKTVESLAKILSQKLDGDKQTFMKSIACYLFGQKSSDIPKGYIPFAHIKEALMFDPFTQKPIDNHYGFDIVSSQRGKGYMKFLRNERVQRYGVKKTIYSANVLNIAFLLKNGYNIAGTYHDLNISLEEIQQIIRNGLPPALEALKKGEDAYQVLATLSNLSPGIIQLEYVGKSI